MAEKTPSKRPTGTRSSGGMEDFLDLYGKAVDALIARSKTEEPFSADLAGTIEPTLRSLASTKETLLHSVREELAKAPKESRATFDEQVRAVGALDLLEAAIAAGQIPSADVSVSVKSISMPSGARRIPWLEIIKEILEVLLDLIPIIPKFLKKLLKELLDILDKIFEGMRHQDNATS